MRKGKTADDDIIADALALPDVQKRALAWKLFDAVGISVLCAIDADDIIDERDGALAPPISKAKIIEVLGEVAELDWSDLAAGPRDAIEERLAKLEIANG